MSKLKIVNKNSSAYHILSYRPQFRGILFYYKLITIVELKIFFLIWSFTIVTSIVVLLLFFMNLKFKTRTCSSRTAKTNKTSRKIKKNLHET